MSIQIIPTEQQGDGAFNGGAILEKKPIPFMSEYHGKGLLPYSNLFYWAHAWSEKGSTIGEHPHQAFEIMSFVLKGNIRHYDNKNKKWIPLSEGDVQIIRAGNGISHAEHIEAGSEIFQIWFDPEIRQALQKPASYDDCKSATFKTITEDNADTRILVGEGSPIQMDSEKIRIVEKTFSNGTQKIKLQQEFIYSVFVLSGALTVDDKKIDARDFFIVKEKTELNFTTDECKLFIIQSPLKVSYSTYASSRVG